MCFEYMDKSNKHLFILKIKWFYKNIIKKPLSPNGERGLGREVKKIISF
jgi:hypothetical protein